MATRVRRLLRRLMRVVAAMVLLLVGALTTPTPVPVGLVLVATGSAILLIESRRARRSFRGIRRRFPGFSRCVRQASGHLPRRMQRLLDRTDPFAGNEPEG